MARIALLFILGATLTAAALPAFASEYKCSGDRVERGGLTKYRVRWSGNDFTIEKGGLTKGKAVRRNNKYFVEISGLTEATIENDKIYRGGSTWASVDDAREIYDCGSNIAAALWVLDNLGALDDSSSGSSREFKCDEDRVTRSGSTKYRVRWSGNDFTIEKSGSTRGKAVRRSDKYYVEVSGSTKATIENGKIYRSGSTWASVEDAREIYDCPGHIAATLWVLENVGALD